MSEEWAILPIVLVVWDKLPIVSPTVTTLWQMWVTVPPLRLIVAIYGVGSMGNTSDPIVHNSRRVWITVPIIMRSALLTFLFFLFSHRKNGKKMEYRKNTFSQPRQNPNNPTRQPTHLLHTTSPGLLHLMLPCSVNSGIPPRLP